MKDINIQEHFAKQASDYEALMTRLVPQYLEQHKIIFDLLPSDKNKNYRVLDLGCGNGILSEIVLKKLPNSHITGFDITTEMLDAYEQKISKYTKNYELIQGDYKIDSIGKSYDIILTGMTLHHLNWEERKVFYQKLFNSANQNAVYISNDIIIDEDNNVKEHQYSLWKQFMKEQGENPEFWYEKHIEKDFPIILSNHFDWLKEVGFQQSACYWRMYNFAITKAIKL